MLLLPDGLLELLESEAGALDGDELLDLFVPLAVPDRRHPERARAAGRRGERSDVGPPRNAPNDGGFARGVAKRFPLPLSVARRRPAGMPSHKSLRTKRLLAKKIRQNRPIPNWFRYKTDNTIRWNAKRRNWRRTKLNI